MHAGHLRFFAAALFAHFCFCSCIVDAQTSPPAAPSLAGSSAPASAASSPLKHVGGSVSAPTIANQVALQYTDQARKAGISGAVQLGLQVDERGDPSHVHVIRGLGYGLDENAVQAVQQYKFKPALEAGKPVAVELTIQVNFQFDPIKPEPFQSDPKFVAAIAEAKQLQSTNQVGFAIDAYKKANKIAGGRCADCLHRMAALELDTAKFKDAAAAAVELVALASTPLEKSNAERLEGQALYQQAGDKPKPAQLQAADQLLKAAIADYPNNTAAHFCDGTVLARMGQTDDARKQFEACIAQASPSDPSYLRAQHFAENPALSYAKMAPAFTVTALDGSKFTLDAMTGKVVLIDFWATWCGPCNEELPHMKKIAKEFAGQPLVIISVSWDEDAAKWKSFIAKNEMTWLQYRDADHILTQRFGVDAIPHYFTIDTDGVLTSEMMGSGSDVEGKLRKLIAKATATRPQAQATTASLVSPRSN